MKRVYIIRQKGFDCGLRVSAKSENKAWTKFARTRNVNRDDFVIYEF